MITYAFVGYAAFAMLTLIASHMADPGTISPKLFRALYFFSATSAASAFATHAVTGRIAYSVVTIIGYGVFALAYLLATAIAYDLKKRDKDMIWKIEEIRDNRK